MINTKSPTALNKRGNKVTMDGYTFDSDKEARFYRRFVKDCGYKFDVHPRFILEPLHPMKVGKVPATAYTPDFVIYDKDGEFLHVIDVKNSFGAYGIDQAAKLRFRQFNRKYDHPVEAVVVRANDFKVITQGVTKPLNEKEPFVTRDFNYRWIDATRY